MKKRLIQTSKFLSLILRHRPDEIGLSLDPQGWASVDELIERAQRHGVRLTREVLHEVVATNDKARFALSPDGSRIRASQGHSIDVDLGLAPVTPPPLLYHGTAEHSLASILESGLHPASRQYVHLSPDEATAVTVGRRHGSPVVLQVDSGRMHRDGHPFFRSENGVWLVTAVAPMYLQVLDPPRPTVD